MNTTKTHFSSIAAHVSLAFLLACAAACTQNRAAPIIHEPVDSYFAMLSDVHAPKAHAVVLSVLGLRQASPTSLTVVLGIVGDGESVQEVASTMALLLRGEPTKIFELSRDSKVLDVMSELASTPVRSPPPLVTYEAVPGFRRELSSGQVACVLPWNLEMKHSLDSGQYSVTMLQSVVSAKIAEVDNVAVVFGATSKEWVVP